MRIIGIHSHEQLQSTGGSRANKNNDNISDSLGETVNAESTLEPRRAHYDELWKTSIVMHQGLRVL
jgi:hypothetical protein